MAPDLLREGPSSGDVSAEDGGGAEPPAEDRSGDARHGDILACKEETGYGRSGGAAAAVNTGGVGCTRG